MNKNIWNKIMAMINDSSFEKGAKDWTEYVYKNPAIFGLSAPTGGAQISTWSGINQVRPLHQVAKEKAYNQGNLPLVKKIIDNIPKGDPYKSSMLNLIARLTGALPR